jgi:hypothetical protein
MFNWIKLFKLNLFGMWIDEPPKGSGGTDESKLNKPVESENVIDNKIPYDRFKKVNDENKLLKEQAAKIETEKVEADKKRLEQEGKWQEAAELSEKRAIEAEDKAKKSNEIHIVKMREYEIGMEAKNQGIADVKDAIKLIDNSNIILNEDGTFSGMKEAVEKLKTDKAYLFVAENGSLGVHTQKPKGATMTTREELLADPIAATKLKQDNPAEFKRILGV